MFTKDFVVIGSSILLCASLTSASPHPIVRDTVEALYKRQSTPVYSPDNTCGSVFGGAGNNWTCGPDNLGTCCSQYGYCGATADYCGTGCQQAFGTCAGDPTEPPVEDPFLCGPANNNWRCTSGLCCSQGGFCGNTTDYCTQPGCQDAYGVCDGGEEPDDGAGRCGPQFSNRVCTSNECCSPAGYCGNGEDYCNAPDCLVGFGRCDSDYTPEGASTANIARPVLGSVPYGEDIWECFRNPGQIALTYDDGPYFYTEALLDTLEAYNFKATFFVTGINNGKGSIDSTSTDWPRLLQRMITDGHQVASHTWSHLDLSTLTAAQQETEMVKNEMAFRNVLGKFPTYMRPPYSSCNALCLQTLARLGYHVTYFDLDTQDYLHTTPETNQISKDVVEDYLTNRSPATQNYLSIAHDLHWQTVHNLTIFMFDEMVRLGWRGVQAGTCLNDPETNWYRDAGGSSSTSTTASSTSSATSSTATPTTTPTTISTISTTRGTTTATPTPTPTTATTATPSPTSNCATYEVGSFCARPINNFTNRITCTTASLACTQDYNRCVSTSGNNASRCAPFKTAWCDVLSDFCSDCPFLGRCNRADLPI